MGSRGDLILMGKGKEEFEILTPTGILETLPVEHGKILAMAREGKGSFKIVQPGVVQTFPDDFLHVQRRSTPHPLNSPARAGID
ncbi:MAG: hypothetical protein ABSH53_20875 [Holophaga sp.]